MNSFTSLLQRLSAIGGMQGTQVHEEQHVDEAEVEEGNEFSGALAKAKASGEEEFEVDGKKYKVNECGDMQMGAEMSPMSAVSDMALPIQVIGNPEAAPEMPHTEEPAVEDIAPKYTLSIRNGDSHLDITTDTPDEIIHIMKLAGVKGDVMSAPKADDTSVPKEVEEEFENTPSATREKNPTAYGDIRDWGLKGSGSSAGKDYPGTKASGDNPLSEATMLKDYKAFKANK